MKPGKSQGLKKQGKASATGAISVPRSFQDEMAQSFGIGLNVAPLGEPAFHAEMEGYAGEKLRFAALHFSAHTTTSARYRADIPRMLITLSQDGKMVVNQDGRRADIAPDHVCMIDPARPFQIETGSLRTHSLYVDMAPLRNVLPGVEQMTARAVSTRTGVGAILKSLVNQMLAERDRLNERQADALAAAIPYLVAAVFAEFTEEQAPISAHRHHHRNRVIDCIDARLSHAELNVAHIAQDVGISVRYIHDLFAETGTSVMQHVWQRRLDHAYAELVSPLMRHRSVSEIAFAWGFKHPAHFSRLFRDTFGTSPRDIRKKATPLTEPNTKNEIINKINIRD